jgi:hypothetical protein
VSRSRLAAIALAITALLAVVAVAARGRPLSASGGTRAGPPAAFFDYAFTTFFILTVLAAVAAVVVLFIARPDPGKRKAFHTRVIRSLAVLLALAALLVLIGHRVDLNRLLHPHQNSTFHARTTGGQGSRQRPGSAQSPRSIHFRWGELVVVLALLLALGATAAAARSRRLNAMSRQKPAPEVLAAVLDESLDDLRTDPDLRRAIVAAYARMEVALAAAGLPRRPAEAPLEYLERALLSLDTSAEAVRRLTDLFEWARFSQYEPEPSMRDEAVDALVAVRDELRASEPVVT